MTLDDWLARTRDALEARWPGVVLGAPGPHLARHLAATDTPDALASADLLLAAAALQHDARALAYLDALLITEVRRAVSPLDTSGVLVDETTQLVRERLLLVGPDGHARLADYSGEGSLGAWLRAVAVRIALNSKRPGAREELVGDLPDSPLADPDPELALLRARYRESFRAAVTEALTALTPRDRTMLRLTAIDGLTCARVGQMYGKDASTISRWLAQSRAVLLERTRGTLAKSLQLTDSALDSVMRAADSELNLSISKLLESSAG